MVSSINLTYIRSQFQNKKRHGILVLAKGGWSHSEDQQDTYIDCLSSSGSFGRANQNRMPITTIYFLKDPESDIAISTTPITGTVQPPPTQCEVVEYDTDGRPQHIYLPNTDDDEWSVSTLGSTIISDSRPGSNLRGIPLTATFENLIGTF